MMVTFVSQCEKNALNKTRRVLDAFANRIGDKTWQAIITNEGLNAVKKLLRKTASKNTAVSCHWLRSRSRSELVWIVGDRQKFNSQGIVPVNSTLQPIVNTHWENDWHYLPVIKSLSALAALFHDFGKSSICFQKKLNRGAKKSDPLRHEWVSVLLFHAFVNGKTDEQWLEQLARGELDQASIMKAAAEKIENPLGKLPSIAGLVAWLIVSHHRLPLLDGDKKGEWKYESAATPAELFGRISQVWGYENSREKDFIKQCLSFPRGLPSQSRPWLKSVKRWAAKMCDALPLAAQTVADGSWRLILHHARLALMLGDHHYSSRKADESWQSTVELFANTDRETKKLKQKLDEHLVGVADSALQVAHLLPAFETELECAHDLKSLKKKSPPAFSWQDKAVEQIKTWKQSLPVSQQENAYGFFAVNLASTGCGKTHANAKVMRALSSDGDSLRFILALGLRTLTLQTGDEYRNRIGLDNGELAVIIGSRAIMELHQQNQIAQLSSEKIDNEEVAGSESAEPLLGDEVIDYEGPIPDSKLNTILKEDRDRQLLYAPVLVCTIDHIMPATECKRGGRYILPSLRLMSSDLVIDEIDDFDVKDLIAIGRLIHLAGMLGRKVMISSATIPPDLAEGYFNAYREGWSLFAKARQLNSKIGCAWIDELNTTVETVLEVDATKNYRSHHQRFVEKRVERLKRQSVKRIAEIISCEHIKQQITKIDGKRDEAIETAYFQTIQQAIVTKHQQHASVDPITKKSVSFGLVRMANIDPCVALTRYLVEAEWPQDIDVRVMAYHSQQILLLRHTQEKHLDAVLKRHQADGVFNNPTVRRHINSSPSQHIIFIVVATPVEEIGRDHDFDWAVVEPSSLRSIIQLVGRVLRHRNGVPTQPNVALLQYNLRALKNKSSEGLAYYQPGYERDEKGYRLKSHDLSQLINSGFLRSINAIPRIQRSAELQSSLSLADLEHYAISQALTAYDEVGAKFLQGWLTQCWWLTALPQLFNPFRGSDDQKLKLFWVPEGDEFQFVERDDNGAIVVVDRRYSQEPPPLSKQGQDRLWLGEELDYPNLLVEKAKKQGLSLSKAALRYGEVVVPYHQQGRQYQYLPCFGLSRCRKG